MGTHIVENEFQSDKYPTTPRGKVPLSVKDATAQDLLWEYAQRRRAVDAEFADDLETCLKAAGFHPPANRMGPLFVPLPPNEFTSIVERIEAAVEDQRTVARHMDEATSDAKRAAENLEAAASRAQRAADAMANAVRSR